MASSSSSMTFKLHLMKQLLHPALLSAFQRHLLPVSPLVSCFIANTTEGDQHLHTGIQRNTMRALSINVVKSFIDLAGIAGLGKSHFYISLPVCQFVPVSRETPFYMET